LEEEWDKALANVNKYQESHKHHYNKCVVTQQPKIDNLVLKKDNQTKDKHMFSSPWDGPFILVDIVAPGAYVLAEVNGNMLSNT
jgi:hypothetical protein